MTDYDVAVIGSGVAGLSTALGLAGVRRVALVTSGPLQSGSTTWAQGGLAAAIGAGDAGALHASDTADAGARFGDDDAIRVLTDAAPTALADLLRAGGRLDRDSHGRLALTREGGHHRRRVVHAGGDASGAEVSRALVAAVEASTVSVIADTTVEDLLCTTTTGPQVVGVVLRHADGSLTEVAARAVVLATGGIGGLFRRTTNPAEVRGTGLGLALRAGASLVDLEFVQFHPTALDVAGLIGQVPLISEALRGEGAVLRDHSGRPIMAGQHPLGDLAPRDIVARRVDEVITGGEPVVLDPSAVEGDLDQRFPTIAAACRAHGIDPTGEPIPVAPTQHFLCGGVQTDSWGATDVIGLYAVGEVAATGVHGANRLASNSLVEGMVFGRRVASRLILDLPAPAAGAAVRVAAPAVAPECLPALRELISTHAGIRRTAAGLELAAKELDALVGSGSGAIDGAGDEWLAAQAIVAAAAARSESRGCHWRSDHPATNEWWRRRIAVRLDRSGAPVAMPAELLGRTA
jgi:L-aspartate oxidase